MKNFTIIPNELFEKSQLSVPARMLLCTLLKYCGQKDMCYPSQQTLSENLLCTPRHIRNLLDELLQAKLITKQRTGFNKSNTYTVTKQFKIVGNYSSPHLRSKFPLNPGTTIPPKNTYIKTKGKIYTSLLRKRAKELGLHSKAVEQLKSS